MTPPARDDGHDIFLERGGMAWIVECKLYDRGHLQMLGERQMSRRRGSFRSGDSGRFVPAVGSFCGLDGTGETC